MNTLKTRTLTADALKRAAHTSLQMLIWIGSDPQSGRILADPLRDLIPGDANATTEAIAVVQNITGKTISKGTGPDKFANTAPAARAALRRWAMKEEGSE